MIQRKQTLFLLQVIFLHIALLFISTQTVLTKSASLNVHLTPFQNSELNSNFYHYLAIAVNFCGLILAFATLFMFKKRELQVKMCLALMSLWTKLTVLITFFTMVKDNENILSVQKNYFNLLIGVFAIVASYFAMRFIKKDIALIKSADRLR